MNPKILIVLFFVTLSCRAQTSAAAAPAAQPDPQPTLAPVVVESSSDSETSSTELKKDLAEMRAEQHASMAQALAEEARNQKAAFTGIMMIERPNLIVPKLAAIAGPALVFAPATETKSRSADIAHSK